MTENIKFLSLKNESMKDYSHVSSNNIEIVQLAFF